MKVICSGETEGTKETILPKIWKEQVTMWQSLTFLEYVTNLKHAFKGAELFCISIISQSTAAVVFEQNIEKRC